MTAPPPLLGLVIPGRPFTADFATAPDGAKLFLDVPAPRTVPELTLFLLPGAATLPPGSGLVIYWALPPFETYSALGALTAEAPSATFRTGFAATPEISAAPLVRIGVSLESADVCANLTATQALAREQRAAGFARLLAADVGTFLGSFAMRTPEGERLVIPPTALDVWLRRVEERFRSDPEFLRHSA